jgi:serine/threonine protein kinase
MAEDTRIGTEVAGYRIEALIGRGGMGAVYLAEHLRLGRKVALKLLAPELAGNEKFRDRFLRESKIAASIDHPNIVPIFDADEADGVLFLAMRYVEGTDLRGLIIAE